MSFSGLEQASASSSNFPSWCINVLTTAHHLIWQTRSGRYQMSATGRGSGHQTGLMFSCQEPKLKWAIGLLRSLVHVLGTAFLQLFGKPKPFLLSKAIETVLDR